MKVNGKCYFMNNFFLNFDEADIECQRLPGGTLATFQTKKELEALNNLR